MGYLQLIREMEKRRDHSMTKETVWKVVKGAGTIAVTLITVSAEVLKEVWRQYSEKRKN